MSCFFNPFIEMLIFIFPKKIELFHNSTSQVTCEQVNILESERKCFHMERFQLPQDRFGLTSCENALLICIEDTTNGRL